MTRALDLYELSGRPGEYVSDVVALSFEGAKAPLEIQLGYTDRFDGYHGGAFELTKQTFDNFVTNHEARGVDPAIDREHESLRGSLEGAQGWIKKLSYRDIAGGADAGKPRLGLFGGVDWSDLGEENVAKKRFRYVSMGFMRHAVDGRTKKPMGAALGHVSLVKNPFIDGMQALSLSASNFPGRGRADGGPTMDQVRKYFCSLLGLNAAASDDEILEAARKREGDIKLAWQRGVGMALSADAIKSLGMTGEPTEEAVSKVILAWDGELKTLRKEKIAGEVDALIAAKKATPAEREDLIELASKDYEYFKRSTGKRVAIAALSATVNTPDKPSGANKQAKREKAIDAYIAAHKDVDFTQALVACAAADPELFHDDQVEG